MSRAEMTIDFTRPQLRAARPIALRAIMPRLISVLVGAALIFAALGIWAVPSSMDAPESGLRTLASSLTMLIVGLCLLAAAQKPRRD